MPTRNYFYIGNRELADPTPTSNITQPQANALAGYTASGRGQLGPTQVTGTLRSGETSYAPTYISPATNFTYTNPITGAASASQVRTFVSATFEVQVPDGNGGLRVVVKQGILMQMNNGDMFIRPNATLADQWTDLPAIAGITIRSATIQPSTTRMNAVSEFSSAIFEVPVVCFCAGTFITTDGGEILVEDLAVGDKVWTKDNGFQAIRWIGRTKLSADHLNANPKLRPIRIEAGALGRGVPTSDLFVSPQHRVLVSSKIALRMFDVPEVLVAAKQLVLVDGVSIDDSVELVEYVHFLLERHEIILSNGAETESLFTGKEALKAVNPEGHAEILALFPDINSANFTPQPVRHIPSNRTARAMAARHVQNKRSLVS